MVNERNEKEKYVPEIRGNLKKLIVKVPETITEASGININGRILHSFMFTTDPAIVCNMNADAVIALYPFYPQPVIIQSVLTASRVPVFCGIGDQILTLLERMINIAKQAEYQGATGIVVNASISNDALKSLARVLDIPIILTITAETTDIKARLESGAAILNVSAAQKTPEIIAGIRAEYPYVPIMANGGPTEESIAFTIAAGANAITYTPPSLTSLFIALAEERRRKEMERAD